MMAKIRKRLERIIRGGGVAEKAKIKLVVLAPHAFAIERKFIDDPEPPRILMTPEVCSDIQILIQLAGSDELSWLGTVAEILPNIFLIDRIFIIGQEVESYTTVMTEDGLGELFTELADTDMDACERMHFWGHVHPGDTTNPSGQDEDQMKLFGHNEWFIRAIFGRNGRAEFTFFDYANGLRWNDVSWRMYHPTSAARYTELSEEVKNKVKKTVKYVSSPYHGAGNFRYTPGAHAGSTTVVGKSWSGDWPTSEDDEDGADGIAAPDSRKPAVADAPKFSAENADEETGGSASGAREFHSATLADAARLADRSFHPGERRLPIRDVVSMAKPAATVPPAVPIPHIAIPGRPDPAAAHAAEPEKPNSPAGVFQRSFQALHGILSTPADLPPLDQDASTSAEEDETGGLGHD